MRALQVREGSVMDGRVDPICLHVQDSEVTSAYLKFFIGFPVGTQVFNLSNRGFPDCLCSPGVFFILSVFLRSLDSDIL